MDRQRDLFGAGCRDRRMRVGEAVTSPERADGVLAVPTVSALVSATDPQGDASASQGNGLSGEAYQDIVGRDGRCGRRTFTFAMDVAASVPAAPVLPGGIKVQEWDWNINTSPELPRGFPFSSGSAAPPEFIVMVRWDGSAFNGILIDRRPLLIGGEAVSTSIPFDIDGATISYGQCETCWTTYRASRGLPGRTIGPTWAAAAYRRWIVRPILRRPFGPRVSLRRSHARGARELESLVEEALDGFASRHLARTSSDATST